MAKIRKLSGTSLSPFLPKPIIHGPLFPPVTLNTLKHPSLRKYALHLASLLAALKVFSLCTL
ncbi:MAG TPA: hypothetical protein VFA02_02680, partial [Pseudacidobacterium sp.]|nr:hypothetical protein [Pseudacidobacterium sp.]